RPLSFGQMRRFSFRLSPACPGRVGGLLPETRLTRTGRQPIWPKPLDRQEQDDRHGEAEDWRIRQPGEDRSHQDRVADRPPDDADDDHGADHDDVAVAVLPGRRHGFQRDRRLADVARALSALTQGYADIWRAGTSFTPIRVSKTRFAMRFL